MLKTKGLITIFMATDEFLSGYQPGQLFER
jgi:hypothetical protein